MQDKNPTHRKQPPQFRTITVHRTPHGLEIRTKANRWLAGVIDLKSSTFRSAPRNRKNIYRGFGEPALCLNSELLDNFNFETIEIPFEHQVLRTSRRRWITEGIQLGMNDSKVDRQTALFIDRITLEPKPEVNPQLSIFDESEVA